MDTVPQHLWCRTQINLKSQSVLVGLIWEIKLWKANWFGPRRGREGVVHVQVSGLLKNIKHQLEELSPHQTVVLIEKLLNYQPGYGSSYPFSPSPTLCHNHSDQKQTAHRVTDLKLLIWTIYSIPMTLWFHLVWEPWLPDLIIQSVLWRRTYKPASQ